MAPHSHLLCPQPQPNAAVKDGLKPTINTVSQPQPYCGLCTTSSHTRSICHTPVHDIFATPAVKPAAAPKHTLPSHPDISTGGHLILGDFGRPQHPLSLHAQCDWLPLYILRSVYQACTCGRLVCRFTNAVQMCVCAAHTSTPGQLQQACMTPPAHLETIQLDTHTHAYYSCSTYLQITNRTLPLSRHCIGRHISSEQTLHSRAQFLPANTA